MKSLSPSRELCVLRRATPHYAFLPNPSLLFTLQHPSAHPFHPLPNHLSARVGTRYPVRSRGICHLGPIQFA